VLAVVPARSGSKGLPGKNLRQVAGNTLIGHACRIAAATTQVRRVVITSDDRRLGEEGMRNGADLFVLRPAELSTDEATSADAWVHAWRTAEEHFGERFALSVLLQPTSPTREVQDVEAVIDHLSERRATASVTVSPTPKHFAPHKMVRITPEGRVVPVIPGTVPNARRQDVPDAYWLNGHCYGVSRDPFLRDRVVIPPDAVPVVIDRPLANIDDAWDLEYADWLLSRRGAGTGQP
jgi:CMP-N,N'-diacetyllegionaminic acid synthase